ncbi:DUF3581 domain-containing protein [Salinispirillum sp. LH 10-3-1]|uniref:DUF3581 domain-containing protein n=1 Tax=Salinispirillum sp. LH 10-3-1 TaxID=2952525 RepID=A0AB38YBP4_9GAMM
MFLDPYFEQQNQQIVISAAQASAFAKDVAGDFNPIHNVDSKRFCVPGDLLFALVLSHYGLSQSMSVRFSGMVGANVPLMLPTQDTGTIDILDDTGKAYLHVEHSGDTSRDATQIEAFTRQYVSFSGQNFPFIMVPMMDAKGVMFNPKRPLVIYESMAFELNNVDFKAPVLELAGTELTVNGRRGDAEFRFNITENGTTVGTGTKRLIISGLQPFNREEMDAVIHDFNAAKDAYLNR